MLTLNRHRCSIAMAGKFCLFVGDRDKLPTLYCLYPHGALGFVCSVLLCNF